MGAGSSTTGTTATAVSPTLQTTNVQVEQQAALEFKKFKGSLVDSSDHSGDEINEKLFEDQLDIDAIDRL